LVVVRVLCLGLDGADYDLVRDLLAQGRLPTLSRLSREGAFGPLRSTIPAFTPTAWSSFLTGLNPAGHGIFSFSANPNRTAGRLESAASRAGTPFWRLLGAAGVRSAFVTVPFTYPPEPLAGVVVTGFGGPQRPEILPPAARVRILAAHPGLVASHHPTRWWEDFEGFIRLLIDHIEQIADVCALVLELEPDIGLLCVDFMDSDIAGHLAWHRLDPSHPAHDPAEAGDELVRVYNAVDSACARLIEHAEWLYDEEVTAIVLSDHGMKSTHWNFRVNRWLEEAGFLRYEGRPPRKPRAGRAPFDEIDFSATRAYSFGYGGQVYLGEETGARNDSGVARALADALAGVAHPETGEPAFSVRLKEELYSGAFLDKAPELVLLPHDERIHVDSSRRRWRNTFERHERLVEDGVGHFSGQHAVTGILAAAGPGVRRADVPADAEIVQLPATLLALHGVEADLDAGPIASILAQPAAPARMISAGGPPPVEAPVYTPEEEARMVERLRELGYE
jgi:predicted AlkP superfamily phosphohydrolase/phosphomutase